MYARKKYVSAKNFTSYIYSIIILQKKAMVSPLPIETYIRDDNFHIPYAIFIDDFWKEYGIAQPPTLILQELLREESLWLVFGFYNNDSAVKYAISRTLFLCGLLSSLSVFFRKVGQFLSQGE